MVVFEDGAVGSALGAGLDVRRLEDCEGSFAGDGPAAPVGGGDADAEGLGRGAVRARRGAWRVRVCGAFCGAGAAVVVDPVSASWALRFTASRTDWLDGTGVIA